MPHGTSQARAPLGMREPRTSKARAPPCNRSCMPPPWMNSSEFSPRSAWLITTTCTPTRLCSRVSLLVHLRLTGLRTPSEPTHVLRTGGRIPRIMLGAKQGRARGRSRNRKRVVAQTSEPYSIACYAILFYYICTRILVVMCVLACVNFP